MVLETLMISLGNMASLMMLKRQLYAGYELLVWYVVQTVLNLSIEQSYKEKYSIIFQRFAVRDYSIFLSTLWTWKCLLFLVFCTCRRSVWEVIDWTLMLPYSPNKKISDLAGLIFLQQGSRRNRTFLFMEGWTRWLPRKCFACSMPTYIKYRKIIDRRL